MAGRSEGVKGLEALGVFAPDGYRWKRSLFPTTYTGVGELDLGPIIRQSTRGFLGCGSKISTVRLRDLFPAQDWNHSSGILDVSLYHLSVELRIFQGCGRSRWVDMKMGLPKTPDLVDSIQDWGAG